MKYRVWEDFHFDGVTRLGERFDLDLKAGPVEPKNDLEEHALEHVAINMPWLVSPSDVKKRPSTPEDLEAAERAALEAEAPVEAEV